ncbi:MAG: ATP-dependent Clp protease adaptor ClpS [Desulfoplanes sp.]|nr:ATP-dependent Clp protease adaptor ClpS [Desulfoplanes sp.]
METYVKRAQNNSITEFEPDDTVEDELDEPRRFKVLMHNDDYTTMEFVVEVLMHVFHKNEAEANLIMMNIHQKGVGLCGIYTAEIAETKVSMVDSMAHAKGYPLKCTMEEV